MEMKKAIVIGGSIAGLSCTHALVAAGWMPVVIEKSAAPPGGSPTGAGLCLDPQALRLLNLWIKDPNLLLSSMLPLSIDLNRVTDSEKKISWDLASPKITEVHVVVSFPTTLLKISSFIQHKEGKKKPR